MKANYRVSVDGISIYFNTKEEAIAAAEMAYNQNCEARILVYECRFNRVIAAY